jgi:sugar/nucleoside kinase (ribokinase family)
VDVDILVIGEINPDVVVRDADPRPAFGQVERYVDQIDLVIGSSAAIFACGAARLGLRVAFVGVVGGDAFGRFMLEAMAGRGVDVAACRVELGVPTGASVILSSAADRAILTARGTVPLVRAGDVPPGLLGRARHVHVGSYFLLDALRPDLPALFAAARAGGATTSLDCNWDPAGTWDGGLRATLAETDVFLPNEAEATRITGIADTGAAAAALAAWGPRIVAVKRGAAGALAVTADGERWDAAPLPVVVADTTGAGDSFDAGFLAGLLTGRPVSDALALGIACGSLSTRRAGGTAAQPTLAEAEAALAEAEAALASGVVS